MKGGKSEQPAASSQAEPAIFVIGRRFAKEEKERRKKGPTEGSEKRVRHCEGGDGSVADWRGSTGEGRKREMRQIGEGVRTGGSELTSGKGGAWGCVNVRRKGG